MTGRLIANGVELDLKELVSFPFNYSIADVKEPSKRKRNYSRSVALPGTAANMDFFSSTYQLSLSTVGGTSIAGFNFDPTIRIPARYYNNGALEFNGLLQLNRVKIRGGDYEFECTLFSNYIELFMALGDLKVSELGWSEYDHALTRTNIKNSWNTSVKVNGVDTANFTAGQPNGFGYHYGLVDYGFTRPAPKTFTTGDLFPMVYEREVLLKCLEVAGITPSGSFVDSARFKKCLLGYSGGEKATLPPAETANRRTRFTGDLSTTVDKSGYNIQEDGGDYYASFGMNSLIRLIQDDVLTPVVINDTYAQYEPEDGVITIERTGNYHLSISQTVNIVTDTGAMVYESGITAVTYLVRRNNNIIAAPGIPSYAGGLPDSFAVSVEQDIACNAGDTIKIDLAISGNLKYQLSGDASTLENISIDITDSPNMAFDLTSIQTTLNDGDTIELSRFIPDMKAVDYMTGLITKFNLYISDPDIDDECVVEPLTDFYKPTDQFDDWTQLLDYSKDVIIEPSSRIEGKFYKFKWAEDDDYDNKRYRDRFAIGYGDYTFESESTFAKGDKVYQLPFAQTIPTDELTPLIVPRIISYDEQTGAKKPFKGKPRVYMLNGLKTGGWRLSDIDGVAYEDLTTYPSVHHFDNWQAPTFDMNFCLPQELQYTTGVVTNNNLFTAYHRDFLLDITGRDSKLLIANFKLNSFMIENMDFGKLKMINGVLFRLNEIRDFDSTTESTTECELLKIVAAKKPKTFLTLSITKPAKKTPPVIKSPSGAAGVSASTGVMRGGLNDALATTSKIIG